MNFEPTTDFSSKLILQGVHVGLTDGMQNILREKFAALLRHNDRIIRIHVRLHQDQTMGSEHHYTVTGQIKIRGPELVASAEGKDAYDVIDTLVYKLDRLLERRHGRRKERRNHPRAPEVDAKLPKAEEFHERHSF